jgi:hypothetical protein
MNPGHHHQKGGLAAAAGPDDGDEFAFFHFEIQAPESVDAGTLTEALVDNVGFVQILDQEFGHF